MTSSETLTVEHGWRMTPLVYIRVVASARVLDDFDRWRAHNEVYVFHQASMAPPNRDNDAVWLFTGYFHMRHADAIEAWLNEHAPQQWESGGREVL